MQVLLKSKRASNLDERMSRILEISIEQQMEKIEKNYTFLATRHTLFAIMPCFRPSIHIVICYQSFLFLLKQTSSSILMRL